MPQVSPVPVIPLTYGTAHRPGVSRLRQRLASLPTWAVALALLLPVLCFDDLGFAERMPLVRAPAFWPAVMLLYTVAVFLPGAVRRLSVRDGAVMLALAVGWWGLRQVNARHPLPLPLPYAYPLWAAGTVLVVGLGEWLLARPRAAAALPWLAALSMAAGCALALVCEPLQFTDRFLSLPQPGGGGERILPWGTFLYTPLLTLLTWLAVPASLSLGRKGPTARHRPAVAAAGISAALVGSFLLFFHVLLYPLARRSLAGAGPFSRGASVSILSTRGDLEDREALWTQLEKADWTQPEEMNFGSWDYRKACIHTLMVLDQTDTGRRLCQMLLDHPSRTLASFSAKLLAGQYRNAAAPILLRYALLGDSECTRALEAMEVPWAALGVIWEAAMTYRPGPVGTDFAIGSARRERLARLLGADAGPMLSDWTTYYDRVADSLPTRLPQAEAAEAKRVATLMEDYWSTFDRLHKAKDRLFIRRLERDGKGADADGLRGPLQVDVCRNQAFADMAVPPPDWTARGTPELESEVADYARRVDLMIRTQGLAIAPATGPSTAPLGDVGGTEVR